MNAPEIVDYLSKKGVPGTLVIAKTLHGEVTLVSGVQTEIITERMPVMVKGKRNGYKDTDFEKDTHSLYLVYPKNENGYHHIELETSPGPICIISGEQHKHDNNVLQIKLATMGKKKQRFFSLKSLQIVDEPQPAMKRRQPSYMN